MLTVLNNGWPDNCTTCSHFPNGQRFVQYDGTGSNGIMLVGDHPWIQEKLSGLPIQGPAGYLLNKLLRKAGVDRKDFITTNAQWCLPPKLKWHKEQPTVAWEAVDHCRPYLDELIAERKPKVIMALGEVALRRLLSIDNLILHHSYIHDSPYGIPVIPTYHPNFLMMGNHKFSNAFIFALRRALDIAANNGKFERLPVDYVLDRPLPECEAYFRDWNPATMPLSVDIENPVKDKLDEDEEDQMEGVHDDISFAITRVGFSHTVGTGISMPWAEPFISLAMDVIRQAGTQIYWNRNHDVPRLAYHGAKFNGEIHDGMWAWHFLQSDLPKKLGFVAPFYYDGPAWKHLSSSEPAYYNAIDNDAALRCYLGIKRDLEGQGRWEIFDRHCIQTLPILLEMGAAGVLIHRERQQKFAQEIGEEWALAKRELQPLVPESVKPIKIWKKPKPDLLPSLIQRQEKCSCKPTSDELVLAEDEGKPCRKCKGTGMVTVYDQVLDFNPDSPPQVLALMKSLKITPPKHKKTKKDSTDGKAMERLAKKYPVFKGILECRKKADMKTFLYPMGSDDRARTIYTFNPSTWRKSSKKKGVVYVDGRWEPSSQLQNIPKRDKELSKRLRKTMVASPGCTLIESDSAAIEAVLVGYAAGDPDYVRLAKAGVHDFLVSHIVGEPADIAWPDSQLIPYLKDIKKRFGGQQREGCKQTVHLSNYLGSPNTMHMMHPELFPKLRDAEKMQSYYFEVCPKIKPWQRQVLERAHKEQFLDNHFQYRHYFFNTLAYDKDTKQWELGADAKRAIAFIPQSDASAIQTEFLLKLWKDEQVRLYLRLVVHDSIVLEVPTTMLDIVASKVYNVMTAPIPQLGGLSIGAEVQFGPSLGEMQLWQPA